jgi:hypothetical protein
MTKQLYEEALADVKKLKEIAEDNAKRALLEAVTPRIRDLIENQLLGEHDMEEVEADEDKLLMDEFPVEDLTTPAVAVPAVGDAEVSAAAISMPDEEGKVTLDLDALQVPGTDEYELSMESAKALGMLMNSSKDSSVMDQKIRGLDRQVKLVSSAGKLVKESAGFSETLSSIISEVEDTYAYLQTAMKPSPLKESYQKVLKNYLKTLTQLTEQKMNKRIRTLSEADVTLKLTGMPDEVDLDSIGVDLITGGEEEGESEESGDEDLDLGDEGEESESGEGEDELDLGDEEEEESSEEEGSEEKMESRRLSDDTIVEIDEGMLRREISRMKALREADETKAQSWGHGAGDVSDEFEDDDMGDPFVDVDLTTEGDMDEDEDKKMDELDQLDMDEAEDEDKKMEADMDELDELAMDEDEDKKMDEYSMDEDEDKKMDELDMDQAKDEKEMGGNQNEPSDKQSRQPGKTVESLKRRLAAEVNLQTEAKKKATQAKKKQVEAQKKAQQAKKMQEKQQAKKQAKKMQEAYAFYATKFNESVARSNKLKGMLSEAARKGRTLNGAPARSAAEASNLRSKLAETNLFNAKLLFTNKLLQNESLTKRQKAEIIERLDEAKNEREVKLVYESLTKTLGSPKKLTESTERGVIGSSSRPARTASASNSLNEGFEADRWARLAGIVK